MRDNFFHQQLQFSRSFKKMLNVKLSAIGLFHSQWLVLYCLNKLQPITLVEISNYLDVEKPTISRTVKRLIEQKLVEEIPSEDKRVRLVRLTDKGNVSYQNGQAIVTQFEEELLKGIDESDLYIAERTIQLLKEKLHKGEID